MSTVTGLPVLAAAGGSFLLQTRTPEEVFTPEDLNEEQRQIAATAAKFAREEILPAAEAIEAKEPGVLREMIQKAAELGFTSVDIPEEYEGVGMDKVTSALVTDHISALASFSTAFGGQIGIGTLPLVWYGTEEQKKIYLPKLASAEWVAAYALSEATSGSDAMNIRTRATLSQDGRHYLLNGEKMWITNAAIADLYTVFAKIDGEKFSAFLVERTFPGLTIGAEEHKLGIRGSSTCPLVLQDCKVPVENLLGEPGKGHHIAFNVLNVGRFKLGIACVGGARMAMTQMIQYAKERKAFRKSISEFGLIQRKIATASARLFAAESMAYRTVGMMDAALADVDANDPKEVQKRIEEYAVECSILKVYGSEMLSYVADELVATMGGYGYVEEYPAERFYRDARINRIFEGTNEINRMIITGWLMKRAMAGKLGLLPAIKQVMDEVMQPPSFESGDDTGEALAHESEVLAATRKVALFAAGVASQRWMTALQDQQEIMADLADIIAQVYALESALLRAKKLASAKKAAAKVAADMTGLLAEETLALAEQAAKRVMAACGEGDMLRTQLAILRRLVKQTPADAVALSRSVAQACVNADRYPVYGA
ncbi:acyl-CoA dehydrogenase family protein [Occallatibacter riparius]|uniref:Acyl-CoA dehydrogenase family protein n=1 Tax=Occallatibacter riparius TaxID=1002689 RepID=A0A9J7BUG2_9BACT|nr:acyl-CoA dehydrogenase family protein [Occallatibacter riparius]UWZ86303.1 acyl-CoA dehydrogenase family protein [Occallatibacter riparius]